MASLGLCAALWLYAATAAGLVVAAGVTGISRVAILVALGGAVAVVTVRAWVVRVELRDREIVAVNLMSTRVFSDRSQVTASPAYVWWLPMIAGGSGAGITVSFADVTGQSVRVHALLGKHPDDPAVGRLLGADEAQGRES